MAGGWCAQSAPAQFLQEAELLGAQRLKLALGHYVSLADRQLVEVLAGSHVTLVVENDQTPDSKLTPMLHFFHHACDAALPLDMTFDMGNWRWTGEDALQAAAQLSRYVSYIHVKAAVPHGDTSAPLRWMTPTTAGARCCRRCRPMHRAVLSSH